MKNKQSQQKIGNNKNQTERGKQIKMTIEEINETKNWFFEK